MRELRNNPSFKQTPHSTAFIAADASLIGPVPFQRSMERFGILSSSLRSVSSVTCEQLEM